MDVDGKTGEAKARIAAKRLQAVEQIAMRRIQPRRIDTLLRHGGNQQHHLTRYSNLAMAA